VLGPAAGGRVGGPPRARAAGTGFEEVADAEAFLDAAAVGDAEPDAEPDAEGLAAALAEGVAEALPGALPDGLLDGVPLAAP